LFRILRVVIFASCIGAPILHYYYLALEYLFPGLDPWNVVAKIFCDLFLFTPVSILVFFVAIGLMEDKTTQKIQAELEANYLNTLKMGLIVWPIVSGINFIIVPVNFRLFFTGGVSVVWNGYLSYVKNSAPVHDEPILPVTMPKPIAPTLKKIFPFPGKVSIT